MDMKRATKPVMRYHKSVHEFRRLPFSGKNKWDVPDSGGYTGGCEFGRWAAIAYLKMLRSQESVGCGFLQYIVLDMLKRQTSAEPGDGDGGFRGQVVGFFTALDAILHASARADARLDEYSERDLAAAMTRAVNFDEGAWMAALEKLDELRGAQDVPYVPFHAYRKSDVRAAAESA